MRLNPAKGLLTSGCLMFLAIVLLAGCALPEQGLRSLPEYRVEPLAAGYARLNGFLSLKDSRAPAVRMEIDEMSILSGNSWMPLSSDLLLDSESIAAGQVFLGAIQLPEGLYSQLRFTVKGAHVRDVDGDWNEVAENVDVDIELTEPIYLDSESSVALFVSWDVESSIAGRDFTPVLQARGAIRQLPIDLLYVGCPDIDTVFVVRTDTNRVVDAFGVKGGPSWISAVQTGGDGFLYVLAERDRRVKIVDLSNFRTVDFFPAPLNDSPSFMTVDSRGRTAFLLDEKSGYASRINLNSGHVEARVHLDFRPHSATYLEDRGLLAVSLSLSQQVVLLDATTLDTVSRFTSAEKPRGLLAFGSDLYVAEQGAGTVSVYDLNNGRQLRRIMVGYDPVRLIYANNQIYVSHHSDPTLAVLIPGQQLVMREIPFLGAPREMSYDARSRRLFVIDEQQGGLGVIDVNANLLEDRVNFGARAVGLAVMP